MRVSIIVMGATTDHPPQSKPPTDWAVGHEDQLTQLDAALERYESGESVAVAVLSPPLAGRERFLDHVEQRFDTARRIRLDPHRGATDARRWPTSGVLVVDDCQHLFTRRIGGFDVLDRFLEAVATFDGLVVTSWNSYAWGSLRVAKRLGQAFPVALSLDSLSGDELAARLADGGDPEVGLEFQSVDDGNRTDEGLFDVRQTTLPFRGRQVSVPVPTVNSATVMRWRSRNHEESDDRVVFGRVAELSGGNVGAAEAIVRERIRGGRLRLSELGTPLPIPQADGATDFLLQVVLTKERVTLDELDAVVDHPHLDRVLGELARAGLISLDSETAALEPRGLVPVTEALERRRFVW